MGENLLRKQFGVNRKIVRSESVSVITKEKLAGMLSRRASKLALFVKSSSTKLE